MCIGVQLTAQVIMPCGEKVGELSIGQRVSSIEELVTKPTPCKPMSNPRPTI
jgi:hypothetical protein